MVELPQVTDDEMRAGLTQARPYSMVVLRTTPAYDPERSRPIIWEHGRRNFALRAAGLLAVVCPVADDTDVAGFGLFTTDPEATRALMADDPAVLAGIFTADVHPVRSFPGDGLPPA